MTVKEDIAKQIELGFSKEEIIANLKANNHPPEEILDGLKSTDFRNVQNNASTGKTSASSIIFGIIFLGVALVRIGRAMSGNANVFTVVGIFTAIIIAIAYFMRRN
jgi:hypothetical protein